MMRVLLHPLGQQDLAHAVVGFVAAGVVQLVALEVDFRTAEMAGEAFSEPQCAGTSDVVLQIGVELLPERRIAARVEVSPLLHLQDQGHQCLGNKAAAELTKTPPAVRSVAQAIRCWNLVHAPRSPSRPS